MFKSHITNIIFALAASTGALFISCSDDSNHTNGDIKGIVIDKNEKTAIYPANIYNQDSLIATTDESGNYEIKALKEGTYQLLCTAIDYNDTIELVKVDGGSTTTHDFSLRPITMGIIIGEFQDLQLFNESVANNPEIGDWSSEEVFDAATGATISVKTYGYQVADRQIYLDDELLGISDVWGQYGFNIPAGTYTIEGKCDGFTSQLKEIVISPDSKTYLNFFLEKN